MAWYAASSVGFAVEFAWAAGETTIVPYLVSCLGVPFSTAALVFAINPCIAMVLQPFIGRASDALEQRWLCLGGRVPFLILFSVCSVAGTLLLLMADRLFDVESGAAAYASFIAFGILDVSHDALLIPSRALVSDMGAEQGKDEEYHSAFSQAQTLGRLAVLAVGAMPFVARPPGSAVSTEAFALRLLLGLAAVLICVSCVAACLGAIFRSRRLAGTSSCESVSVAETLSVDWHAVVPIVVVHVLGWVGYMVTCFYWSEWVGMNTTVSFFGVASGSAPIVGLAVSAFSGCLSSSWNARFNERYGRETVYKTSLFLNAATLLLAPCASGWWAILLLIPQGASYPVHQTNGQLLISASVPADQAGMAAAIATYAIPLSQVVASVFACLSGQQNSLSSLFLFSGSLCCLAGYASPSRKRPASPSHERAPRRVWQMHGSLSEKMPLLNSV